MQLLRHLSPHLISFFTLTGSSSDFSFDSSSSSLIEMRPDRIEKKEDGQADEKLNEKSNEMKGVEKSEKKKIKN